MPDTSTVFGFVALSLLIAVAIPAAVSVTGDDIQSVYDLDEGDQATVTQQLELVVEETTATDATITLRDDKTLDSETQTITEGDTAKYTIRNESVNVTLKEVEGANANASIGVKYSRTYGWDSGAKTVVDNLPLVLVAAGGLVVIGGIGAFTRRF